MPYEKKIICRPQPSWPNTAAMFSAFGFAWLMRWGLAVACLVGVAASVIVALLPPRRFGRWTE